MGRKARDYTMDRVGKLLVLRRSREDRQGKSRAEPQWVCRCDCGRLVLRTNSEFLRGKGSCDVCNVKTLPPGVPQQPRTWDLEGQRVGSVEVLRPADREEREAVGVDPSETSWICRCDCGDLSLWTHQEVLNGLCRCDCLSGVPSP